MKITVTARNFTSPDSKALELLLRSGFEIVNHIDKNCGTGTTEQQMIELIGDSDIAVTGLEPIGETVLSHCPNLKLISRRSIGYDSVDLEACARHNVHVTRAAGTVEAAVAEHVLAYILYFARRMDLQNQAMHEGKWQRVMAYGAKNRTLGLVGFGGIGKEIAKRAVPFGMKVLYYCRHPKPEWETDYQVTYCDLDTLLRESDYISVNVPLSDSTRRMFGAEQFACMKPECVFINIARGQIVDSDALAQALQTGMIRGAGIDAFDAEPCTDSPLRACENAVLTPHTAPFTSENFSAMNLCAAQNVIHFFDGTLDAKKYQLI